MKTELLQSEDSVMCIDGSLIVDDPFAYNDGSNLYEFVGSNPVNLVDPLGLQATTQPSDPPATTQPNADQDAKDAVNHKRVNCRMWAFNHPRVGRLLSLPEGKTLDDVLKTDASFKEYTENEIKDLGGQSTTKDGPPKPGFHKIVVYRRTYVMGTDFHYGTQDDDGSWSEKETEDNDAEDLANPDDNWVVGGFTYVIGYYEVPSPPRSGAVTPTPK